MFERPPRRCAPMLLALAALMSCAGCTHRASYPVGTTIDFEITCVQHLWPGAATAPREVQEAFCTCVLRRSAERWDIETFDRIRAALAGGGYRPDAPGVPPEFGRLMAQCQQDLERGDLPLE